MTGSIAELRPHLIGVVEQLDLVGDQKQIDGLLQYLALLQRWNSHYNLTAVRDPSDMLTQHLADCLAVVNPIRRECGSVPLSALDVGSGGGLPGVVLAIAAPEIDVTCVDSVGKKAAFVQQVAGELRLPNLRAKHARVESLKGHTFNLVTSRAFASLSDFTTGTHHLLSGTGRWMAMKGKIHTDELAALPSSVEMFHVEQLSVPGLAAERCLVWMRSSAGAR